jgi:BolA family transcriptional regulator, general stress-responsive regulator
VSLCLDFSLLEGESGRPMSNESEINNLLKHFQPTHLEVINESHKHKSGRGAETHFKVIIVSEKFNGLTLIDRHRAVYQCLAGLLPPQSGVHALAIHALSIAEWEKEKLIPNSPLCSNKK